MTIPFLDMGVLHAEALREAQFRRLVRKAMWHEGIRDIDNQVEFFEWALGPKYKDVAYQFWPDLIKERTRLIVSAKDSVYYVFRAAVQLFKSKKVIIRV